MGERITERMFKQCYLSQIGPYIYYYNNKFKDDIDILITNICQIKKEFPGVRVFEIHSIHTFNYIYLYQKDFSNKVYLTYNKNTEEANGHDKQKIYELFHKYTIYFNQKLEEKAQRLGKCGKWKFKIISNASITNIQSNITKNRKDNLKYKRKQILNQKIKIPMDLKFINSENSLIINVNKNSLQEKNSIDNTENSSNQHSVKSTPNVLFTNSIYKDLPSHTLNNTNFYQNSIFRSKNHHLKYF